MHREAIPSFITNMIAHGHLVAYRKAHLLLHCARDVVSKGVEKHVYNKSPVIATCTQEMATHERVPFQPNQLTTSNSPAQTKENLRRWVRCGQYEIDVVAVLAVAAVGLVLTVIAVSLTMFFTTTTGGRSSPTDLHAAACPIFRRTDNLVMDQSQFSALAQSTHLYRFLARADSGHGCACDMEDYEPQWLRFREACDVANGTMLGRWCRSMNTAQMDNSLSVCMPRSKRTVGNQDWFCSQHMMITDNDNWCTCAINTLSTWWIYRDARNVRYNDYCCEPTPDDPISPSFWISYGPSCVKNTPHITPKMPPNTKGSLCPWDHGWGGTGLTLCPNGCDHSQLSGSGCRRTSG